MNTSHEAAAEAEEAGGLNKGNGVTPIEDEMSTTRDELLEAGGRALKQKDAASGNDPKSSVDGQSLTVDDPASKPDEVSGSLLAFTNTDKKPQSIPTPPTSLSDTKVYKRLSTSVENVDLEYSLGSLDSPTSSPASKRQRLEPSSAPSSTGSKKKAVIPMKSFAEAMKPKFWQDSASVSENNKASASFDVAEEEGGSSPLAGESEDEDGADLPKSKKDFRRNRRLSREEERSIAEAEDIMRAAALAAADTPHSNNDGPSTKDFGGDATEKAVKQGSGDEYTEQLKPAQQDSGTDETHSNVSSTLNSNVSSTTSLVYMGEEEYSRQFPPAPPSTPAHPRDAFTPLPYHSEFARGKLSYGDQLQRDELQKIGDQTPFDADSATPPHGNTGGVPSPPFPFESGEAGSVPTRAPRTSKKYPVQVTTPVDMSGAVTEPRRGGGPAKQADRLHPIVRPKSDFDRWEVGDRYELKRMLGRGSYGEVVQAIDRHAASRQKAEEGSSSDEAHSSGSTYVAVKKISKAFDQEVDAIRLYREMHILRKLRGHACVIQLVDVVQPRSSDPEHFNDLYLVFEYVDTDLYKLIMSPQYLTTEHIQTFLYQMLVGVKYIHSSSVIHRDLKPAILLNEDCTLKICDFGLARIVHDSKISPTSTSHFRRENYETGIEGGVSAQATAAKATVQDVTDEASHITGVPRHNLSRQLTKHVVTRWYRAPELILIQPYASAVDIWSIGCIFGELLSMQEGSVPSYQDRVPLFPGGSCFPLSGDHISSSADERLDQLSVIFSVIGMPSEEDLKSIGKADEYVKSLAKKPGRSLESLYPAADPAAINLLTQMLMFNPAKRCTAEEALEHEFLEPVRRREMEVVPNEPLESPEFLERSKIDIATLREETYNEVLWYKQSH